MLVVKYFGSIVSVEFDPVLSRICSWNLTLGIHKLWRLFYFGEFRPGEISLNSFLGTESHAEHICFQAFKNVRHIIDSPRVIDYYKAKMQSTITKGYFNHRSMFYRDSCHQHHATTQPDKSLNYNNIKFRHAIWTWRKSIHHSQHCSRLQQIGHKLQLERFWTRGWIIPTWYFSHITDEIMETAQSIPLTVGPLTKLTKNGSSWICHRILR